MCVLKFWHYLKVPVPGHCKALSHLYMLAHTLGVEVLRWDERYRPRTPREWRLCRFCGMDVETEAHALLICDAHPNLAPACALFLDDMQRVVAVQ